jgi:23S rRNA G2445 N2-methylase RlmL
MGAPLRETLAAAILFKIGWKGDSPLVDGMCGAGTTPIEAVLMVRRLPPGLNRFFLFEKWPAFQPKTWAYLRRKAVENAVTFPSFPVIGVDHDSKAIETAVRNAKNAAVDKDVQWECMDFFNFQPSHFNLMPGVLILNPPYGKRLRGGGEEFYNRLGSHLRQFFKGWRVAVLVPNVGPAVRLGIKPVRFWRIVHGGSPVLVVLAQI